MPSDGCTVKLVIRGYPVATWVIQGFRGDVPGAIEDFHSGLIFPGFPGLTIGSLRKFLGVVQGS